MVQRKIKKVFSRWTPIEYNAKKEFSMLSIRYIEDMLNDAGVGDRTKEDAEIFSGSDKAKRLKFEVTVTLREVK